PARALEFTILTASRNGESRGAIFREIDLAEKTWTVPAERMKGGREHRVPLGSRALAIVQERLEEAPEVAKGDAGDLLVFPGQRAGRPISDMTMSAVIKKLGHSVVTHGFRSTFRTWCGECTNFAREVAEAALAHVNGDKTEAAYLRDGANLFFEKR